jgi:hypothetical protein
VCVLRCVRWYGPGEPGKVFMERKTHREGWKVRRTHMRGSHGATQPSTARNCLLLMADQFST